MNTRQLQAFADEKNVPCAIEETRIYYKITIETGEIENATTFEDAVKIIREYAAGPTTRNRNLRNHLTSAASRPLAQPESNMNKETKIMICGRPVNATAHGDDSPSTYRITDRVARRLEKELGAMPKELTPATPQVGPEYWIYRA